jgi:hypothetical protein
MPRIPATILNAMIVAGMVVLIHRCRIARRIPMLRTYTLFHAKDVFGGGS